MITILPATQDDIPTLRALARCIWHEYYPGIISREQIDYMLGRMYDETTIRREMEDGVAWELVLRQIEPGSVQTGGHGTPRTDAPRGREQLASSEAAVPAPSSFARKSGSHLTESVGFISYSFDVASQGVKLSKLYLLPEWHGHGIGNHMLQHVQARAAQLGASEIQLQVNKQNRRAIRAYQRAGFSVCEAVVTDIGGGFVMDDFIMALRI